MKLRDVFPPLGVVLRAGNLTLRGVTDDVLVDLCALAVRGIHDPAQMPFVTPWTDSPPDELARNTALYHWGERASFSPAAWSLHLAVYEGDVLVGTQAFLTRDYLTTRSGETGSWLGREFQGRGIGTAMRRAVCALALDHLGAVEVTSGAFLDNAASLAVSRKVGYRDNGVRRLARRGEPALNQSLVLTAETFRRGTDTLEVEGVEALRRFIGLDA